MKIACTILFIIWGILTIIGNNNVLKKEYKKFFIPVYIGTAVLFMISIVFLTQGGIK